MKDAAHFVGHDFAQEVELIINDEVYSVNATVSRVGVKKDSDGLWVVGSSLRLVMALSTLPFLPKQGFIFKVRDSRNDVVKARIKEVLLDRHLDLANVELEVIQ